MSFSLVVVDDDAGFRRIARRLLVARGFAVLADAADGDQALTAIRTHRPKGVLLDLQLPGRDGLVVAREITGEPRPPRVVLTSTAAFDRADDLTGWGISAFVAKDALARTDLMRLFTGSDN